jgi:hypothetical protein
MMKKPSPEFQEEFLEPAQKMCFIAKTDSRISVTTTESCMIANTDSFQNFWNNHRKVYDRKHLFPNFWSDLSVSRDSGTATK